MNNNKKAMFEKIRNLCKVCGVGIASISDEFNESPMLVAEMFIQTMQLILEKTKEDSM